MYEPRSATCEVVSGRVPHVAILWAKRSLAEHVFCGEYLIKEKPCSGPENDINNVVNSPWAENKPQKKNLLSWRERVLIGDLLGERVDDLVEGGAGAHGGGGQGHVGLEVATDVHRFALHRVQE